VVRTALNLHVSWWRRRRHETALEPWHDRGGGAPAEPPLDARVLAAVYGTSGGEIGASTVTGLSNRPTGCEAAN